MGCGCVVTSTGKQLFKILLKLFMMVFPVPQGGIVKSLSLNMSLIEGGV